MDYRRMHTGRRWVATLVLLQSSAFPPRDESSSVQSLKSLIVGAGGRGRTGADLLGPRDFKSLASTNSATPACPVNLIRCRWKLLGQPGVAD